MLGRVRSERLAKATSSSTRHTSRITPDVSRYRAPCEATGVGFHCDATKVSKQRNERCVCVCVCVYVCVCV
jgi:hypothetical protein